jgi:hypothetical protein
MPEREQRPPKKAYEPPALTVYGKVYEVTRTVGSRASLDGGTSGGNIYTRIAP